MIIYSVHVSIRSELAQDWQDWMLQKHIPDVMQTGCFVAYKFHKQIEPATEEGYVTFNMRYECESLIQLTYYQSHFAPALQQDHTARYEGKFKATRAVYEVL